MIKHINKFKEKKNLIMVVASNVMVKCIAFFPSVFLARFLTKTELASLSYADNILGYFLIFAGLGMSNSLLRYCTDSDRAKNRAYFNFALKSGIIANIVFAVAGIIVFQNITFSFPNVKMLLITLIFTNVFQYIYECMSYYIRTQMRFGLYSKSNVFFSLEKLVLLILFTYFGGLTGTVISRYACLIVIIILLFKGIDKNENKYYLDKEEKKDYLKYSIATMSSTGLSTLMPLNEMFLVNNILNNSVDTANYKTAMAIPYNLIFLATSIMVYYAPIFSQHEKNSDYGWISKKSKELTAKVAVIYGAITIMMVIGSKYIILFIYGEKYLDSVYLMQVLTLAYAVNAAIRIVPMNILYAIGLVKNNAYNMGISMVVHFALDFVFLNEMGINGVAYASIIVYLLSGIQMWWALNKCVKEKENENKL